MTGIERLRTLSEGSKNTGLLKVIDYLETRKDMYAKYLNEEKTPDQMWQYITNKAKKQAINGCAVIDDKIVYAWAISYFLATNEALGLSNSNNTKKAQEKDTKSNSQKEKSQKTKTNIIDIQNVKSSNQISMFQED